MRSVAISLARAQARRDNLLRQSKALGLQLEFHQALDGRCLGLEHYSMVDRETRRKMGLWPQTDGCIANWFSQRQVMQQIVNSGPEMIAIFEDDATLQPQLLEVLAALESKPFDFDVVKLNRRSLKRPFIPCERLTSTHMAGRVRYSDYGNEGYVITRDAARHFLKNTKQMMWEIDQVLPRFWESGLNVYYVDPPVVLHNIGYGSQIEEDRERSRKIQREEFGKFGILRRRAIAGVHRNIRRRACFPRLMNGEIGVTRWERT